MGVYSLPWNKVKRSFIKSSLKIERSKGLLYSVVLFYLVIRCHIVVIVFQTADVV